MAFELEWRTPDVEDKMQLGYEAFIPLNMRETEEPEPEPGSLAIAAATLRSENPLSSFMESLYYQSEEEDVEGYNVFDELPDDMLQFSEEFLGVRSPDQLRMKEAQIRNEIRDKQIMAQGGAESVMWSLVAGLGDPVNLPLMFLPASVAIKSGASGGRAALVTALGGSLEAGVTETLLHKTQATRTWKESLLNVGGTAVLGGALGGLAGAGQRNSIRALDQADKDIRELVENEGLQMPPKITDDEAIDAGSVGAMRVDRPREQLTVRTGPAFNPLNRLISSPSASSVNTANQLFRHNYYTPQNKVEVFVPEAIVDGKVSPAHTRMEYRSNVNPVEVDNAHDYGSMSAKYLRTINEQFRAMRKRGVKMKKAEFSKAIGRAMRRGDINDEIPEIGVAAQRIRRDVLDPILERYQRLGDLPEDLKPRFAKSYLPRIYDLNAIEKNLPKWNEMLVTHFQDANTTADEAVLLARDITDKIRQSPNGKMPETDFVGESKHLKNRVLNIPDEVLDEAGFLLDNVDDVMQMYLRRTVPEINLKTRFDGDHELSDVIQKIKDDYAGMIERTGDAKKAKKLAQRRDRDIEDITAMRDIMLGRNLPPRADAKALTNMSRSIRSLAFMSNLGMMTISAIPDIARPIMQHGVIAWAKALPRAILYFAKSTKLARRDLEDIGVGVESLLANRAYMIADIDDFGSALHKASRTFGKYSGMNAWNSYMKKIAAFTAQNRFISDSKKYSRLSGRRKERLAKAGIDESMAKRIAKESEKHGDSFGGGTHANTDQWTDREAAETFERVLLRDVDNTIITPGVADRPLFMTNEAGKTILQFKSFFLAAHNQAFIPMMQQLGRGDAAAIQGIMAGIALGMMSEWVRLNLSGRADEFDNYKMRDWARAGLDRSGMASVPMELINMADRFTSGSLSQSMGMMEGSRYFYRNYFGSLLGPTFGYMGDAVNMAQNLARGEGINESDIRAIRRLLPYQNMFYLRQLINEMEGAVADAVDAKPTRRKRGNVSEVIIQ